MVDKLAIIVPCLNEEEVINDTSSRLLYVLEKMIDEKLVSSESTICFVDDGSNDNTPVIIEKLCLENKFFSSLKLTRNFGHQNAIIAGLSEICADVYVSIDADLQDNPNSIIEMVQRYIEGFDIVYGVRNKRETDTFIKRWTARLYYDFLSIIGVDVIKNHADFRLLSSKAVSKLLSYTEKDIMLRLLIPRLGLKSTKVFYDRIKREKGKTKYSLVKMLAFAWTGITSVSVLPIRMILLLGVFLVLVSFLLLLKNIIYFLLVFLTGLIIFSVSVVGEYVAKVLMETKNRPRYQIDAKINL